MDTAVIDIEAILAPLKGENPSGASVRYDDDYETITQEIAKLSAFKPVAINWAMVVASCSSILKERSKDLLVASYCSYALFEVHGYQELGAGLNLFQGLLTNFWDTLFPEMKRLRGRIGAVTWLVERLQKAVSARNPSRADKEAIESALVEIGRLNTVLEEKLSGDAPSLMMLERTLRGYVAAFDAQRLKDEAQSAQAAAAKVAGSVEISSDADITKALRQCQGILKNIITYLRGKSAREPQAYRLNRIATWIMVIAQPPDQNGITQLNAVSRQTLDKFDEYQRCGDYKTLLTEVEETFSQAPFFLDAHRYSAMALEGLGAPYKQARDMVVGQLAAFLRCYPNIIDLKFSDGTAFASDQTRMWIEQEVLAGRAGGELGINLSAGDGDSGPARWEQVATDAKTLASKGKFSDALTLFQEGIRQCQSDREYFFFRLRQAIFCYESGEIEIAIPQLEFLDAQAHDLSLDKWEPNVCVTIVQALLMCHIRTMDQGKKGDLAVSEKAETLFARLCRLDLIAALKIEKRPWQKVATGGGNLSGP